MREPAVVNGTNPRDRRRRIVVTAVVLAAVALLFYVAIFVRFWQ